MVKMIPQQFPPATAPFLTKDGAISVVWYQYLINNQNQVAQNSGYITSLTTTDIPEGTNLYFTASRSRGSIAVAGGLSYNTTTGLITSGTAAGASTGSSGHALPYLDVNNTFGGTQTFGNLTVTGTLTASITGSASSAAKWTTARTLSFTGDITGTNTVDGSANVATGLTLATVNADVGSFGSSTSIPTLTVDAKGRITAASGNAVVAPAGTLSGTSLAAGVTASSLTSVGTLTTLDVAGKATFGDLIKLHADTLASLGSASANPDCVAMATDLTAPTPYAIAVGGGTIRYWVISDGTNWLVG